MSDILTALDSLSAGNDEEIAQYREQTLLAIQRLKRALALPQSIQLSAETSTGDALSSSASHQTAPDLDLTIRCEKILRVIKNRLGAIKKYAKQPDRDAVPEASYKKEDRRIVDVQISRWRDEEDQVYPISQAIGDSVFWPCVHEVSARTTCRSKGRHADQPPAIFRGYVPDRHCG
jgi:hypothetical protein